MTLWRGSLRVLMQNKVLSLLGIAMRGRNLVSGEFQTLEAVRNGSAMLVIIAEDASDNTRKLFTDKCSFYEVPVYRYGTKETLDEITKIKSLGEFPRELLHPIQPDADFSVGDLEIRPFKIDHDAANPVAYRIQNDHASVAVATDMGHYDQYIIDHLQGLDALLLEANHDVRMLETGP